MSAERHIGQTMSGAAYGNILIGGLIGLMIDSSTGAMYNLDPETVSATLVPNPASAPTPSANPVSPSP